MTDPNPPDAAAFAARSVLDPPNWPEQIKSLEVLEQFLPGGKLERFRDRAVLQTQRVQQGTNDLAVRQGIAIMVLTEQMTVERARMHLEGPPDATN